MEKKLIKLTESDLQNMIKKSVSKILREGLLNGNAYDEWEMVKETIGCEQMLQDIQQYLSNDVVINFINWEKRVHELVN